MLQATFADKSSWRGPLNPQTVDTQIMASKPVESGAVLPRSVWPSVLRETVIEVFSIMVGVKAETEGSALNEVMQVTAIIGIAGAIRANLIVQCGQVASVKLASRMLGVSPDDSRSQNAARDALGEICNIVAGHFKAKVGLGEVCGLSVPTIIDGRDYKFHSPGTYQRTELPVFFEGEKLHITLEIAQ